MQTFDQFVHQDNIALAIGFFDGVHTAHRKVISSCVEYAKNNNLKSAVLTFREHPCISIWNVKPQYIVTKQKRIDLISNLGVDYLYIVDFTSNISQLSPNEFIEILYKKISPKAIFTGYNFFFGKNKSGNTDILKRNEKKYDYFYYEIPEQKINNITISSTNIRNYLKSGNIYMANCLLGYEYSFSSKVIEGEKIGRSIGFPTANLEFPEQLMPLKYGVYSACVKYCGQRYNAIINFGTKPTVNTNNNLSVEVHILNFNKTIYGEFITIFPKKYIREQKKFDSIKELKNQISKDILKIKD